MQDFGRRLAASAVAAIVIATTLTRPALPRAWAAAASEDVVVQSDDIRALVAPVALYPDPVLALVLQASTLPLQVVQADRFLSKREKDAKAEPDPEWDPSIVALLNYPRQAQAMSEYIDWTEELGDTVVDNLAAVQDAITDIRIASYEAGFLKSNKQQKVDVEDGIVRINSTDPKKVWIPTYDPVALLTALDDVEAQAAAAEVAAAPAAPAKQAAAPSTKPQQAAAPAPAPAETAPAAAESSAAPATTAAEPAAPGTAAGVVPAEPVTPPQITYNEPESSFWGSAATFAGGAVVGGLLGWGLTEAFDDDDRDWDNDDIQEALRDRRDYRAERRDDLIAARDERREDRTAGRDVEPTTREDRAALARDQLNARPRPEGGRTKPAVAGAAKPKAQPAKAGQSQRKQRDIRLPGAGSQPGVADKVRRRGPAAQTSQASGKPAAAKLPKREAQASAGYTRQRESKAGLAASGGGRKEVRAASDRGARSRTTAAGGGHPRAAPATASRNGKAQKSAVSLASGGGRKDAVGRGSGGSGLSADRGRGAKAKADSTRGRSSRGGGSGRGSRPGSK